MKGMKGHTEQRAACSVQRASQVNITTGRRAPLTQPPRCAAPPAAPATETALQRNRWTRCPTLLDPHNSTEVGPAAPPPSRPPLAPLPLPLHERHGCAASAAAREAPRWAPQTKTPTVGSPEEGGRNRHVSQGEVAAGRQAALRVHPNHRQAGNQPLPASHPPASRRRAPGRRQLAA